MTLTRPSVRSHGEPTPTGAVGAVDPRAQASRAACPCTPFASARVLRTRSTSGARRTDAMAFAGSRESRRTACRSPWLRWQRKGRRPRGVARPVRSAGARLARPAARAGRSTSSPSKRAELGRAELGRGLDRPLLARLCGIVTSIEPRYDLQPVGGVIVTMAEARAKVARQTQRGRGSTSWSRCGCFRHGWQSGPGPGGRAPRSRGRRGRRQRWWAGTRGGGRDGLSRLLFTRARAVRASGEMPPGMWQAGGAGRPRRLGCCGWFTSRMGLLETGY